MRISKNQKLFMKKLVKQKDILNLLASSKRDYKKILIENADKKLFKAKLKKHRKSLVKLADNTTIEEKKKILNQKGGFINILIPAIISGVASIIASIINKPAVIQPVKEVISEKIESESQ